MLRFKPVWGLCAQHEVIILHLGGDRSAGLSSAEQLKDMYRLLCIFLEEELGLFYAIVTFLD